MSTQFIRLIIREGGSGTRFHYVLRSGRKLVFNRPLNADHKEIRIPIEEWRANKMALAKDVFEQQLNPFIIPDIVVEDEVGTTKDTEDTKKLREELEQARRVEQVCYDMHAALGIKWGDDPYARISALQSQDGQVARQEAHNLPTEGSNPSPATTPDEPVTSEPASDRPSKLTPRRRAPRSGDAADAQ